LALPAVVIEPELAWLVLMPSGQAGPYSASHMAQLFEQADLDWTSLVWRSGLKGWRPARRDPQLVTAVASARGTGAWGDTQRVSPPRRSLLPAADTIVDVQPGSPTPFASFGASSTGAAWTDHSEELATQAIGKPKSIEPTFADAFRSAPAILATAAVFEPSKPPAVTARRSSPSSWLPSAQSMLLVAVIAFGFGVLAAAVWGRVLHSSGVQSATVVVRPSASAVPGAASPRAPAAAPIVPSPHQVEVASVAAVPTQEVPSDAQLRREVKRVSPDIRRCVDDLQRGADVEVYFDGPSGRAREVRVRTQGLTPGRLACITQAVRQMQVDAFLQPTHKFWHRFSY
jgi:hypothetical protein